MDNAGTSVKEFGTTVDTAINGKDGVIDDIVALERKTKAYQITATEKFDLAAKAVTNWYKKYGPKLEQGKKKTDELEESIAKLKSKNITINTKVNGED
jgi:hypothetical protein